MLRREAGVRLLLHTAHVVVQARSFATIKPQFSRVVIYLSFASFFALNDGVRRWGFVCFGPLVSILDRCVPNEHSGIRVR